MDDFFINSTACYISRVCRPIKESGEVKRSIAVMEMLLDKELKGFRKRTQDDLREAIKSKMRELKDEK
jgi:hypothetical protein